MQKQIFRTISRFSTLFSLRKLLLLSAFALFILMTPIPGESQYRPNLIWLNQNISCSELTRGVRLRYANLGSLANLDEQTREELDAVLDVICSDRFFKCGFKNCLNQRPELSSDRRPISSEEGSGRPGGIYLQAEREESEKLREDRLRAYQQYAQKQIQDSIAREISERRAWVPVSIHSEPDRTTDRPADTRASARTYSTERGSSPIRFSSSDDIRPRPLFRLRAALPAIPQIDISGNLSARAKYLPRSSATFHRPTASPVIRIRPSKNSPGAHLNQ